MPSWTQSWYRVLPHAIAFVAGIAVAIIFMSHAAQFKDSVRIPPLSATASEFDRALQIVMVQMNTEMCITPSGDADRDFAHAMIPHHQGAVEMAKLELLHGHDARLRRLAQGMVVEQTLEIALMRSILARSAPAPDAVVRP